MVWAWLRSLGRRKSPEEWDVVMYTRQGCHLCEQAWEQLERARQRRPLVLRKIDVDGDPELVRRFGEWVPVVVMNGKVRFRGSINPVLLERLLGSG